MHTQLYLLFPWNHGCHPFSPLKPTDVPQSSRAGRGAILGAYPPGWDTVKNPRKLPLAAVGSHGAQTRRSARPSGTRGPDPVSLVLLGNQTLSSIGDKWATLEFQSFGPAVVERGSALALSQTFPARLDAKGGECHPGVAGWPWGAPKGRCAPQKSGEGATGLPYEPHPNPSPSSTDPLVCPDS